MILDKIDKILIEINEEYKLDKKYKISMPVDRYETVVEIGVANGTFYWKHKQGLKNAYRDLQKFRYSLSQELASQQNASKLIKQLADKQYEARKKVGTL